MSETNLMLLLAGVAGLLLPYLIEFLKRYMNLDIGRAKAIAPMIVSFGAAAIIALLTKQIDLATIKSYEDVVAAYAVLYTISQAFYQLYLKPHLSK